MVEVIVTDEFKAWYEDLSEGQQESVFHVVGLLEGAAPRSASRTAVI